MPRYTVDSLPLECPWGGFTPPNVDWCEEELCAWVVNPADTWSNLIYIVLGVVMWRSARRDSAPILGLFGPASIAVGVFSFAYHASYTYFLQFFDFVGMFVFCFTVITANALRLGWIGEGRRWHFFLGGVAIFSALVPVVSESPVPIQALVGFLIAAIIEQEILLKRKAQASDPPVAYGPFFASLALMAAAGGFSLADVTRTWCDPSNHWIQGHAIWHVLSACALYALYRFYATLSHADP